VIRARKVRAVAVFELLCTLRRKAYLITTFGMPVFVLLYLGVFSVVGFLSGRKQAQEVRVFAVVDGSGVLDLAGDVPITPGDLPEKLRRALDASGRTADLEGGLLGWRGNSVFRPLGERDAAVAAVAAGDLAGCFVLEADYIETGRVELFLPDDVDLEAGQARRALAHLLVDRLLGTQVSERIGERVRQPIDTCERWTVTAEGEVQPHNVMGVVVKIVVPIVFAMLLFLSLMMSASYLLQATATEKENKVVEVLLSSAGPDEILAGKLVGLGLAGMGQVLVWFGMIVVAGLVAAGTLAGLGVEMPWPGIIAALLFFPVTYLFLGSLMLGTGALGGNLKESNQLSMVWSLPSAAPLMFLGVLIPDPHGALARVLTWIPFTAPVTVIFRSTIDFDGIAWWEIAGPLTLVTLATWVTVRIGARLFRVGLLLTGSRPKLREILRQARLSA
jgi:ABC-2 type transport system permease protein